MIRTVAVSLAGALLALSASPVGAGETDASATTTTSVSSANAVVEPQSGDQPPPGAVDGIPVGAEGNTEQPAGQRQATADRAATTRYFSRAVHDDIRQVVSGTPRPCPVSDNGLTALVLAPIFRESSAGTSPSAVPSPMTLSRFDEWDGSTSNTSNAATNRTLYEARNPQSPYSRAYWHPGVGIWQFDSAGLGAPYTASDRMDARILSPGIAGPMMTRYCNVKSSGGSDLSARAAAWQPWVGCANNGCEQVFHDMMSTGFANLELVDDVSHLGGTEMRNCSLGGPSFACAYVDPMKAEGARWWVDLSPDDGNPTSAPAPLSLPFYVFERDGKEHRHWLQEDTNYAVDISATRTMGKNARARTDQPGSGLAWSRTSQLCDMTALHGRCEALPPATRSLQYLAVGGDYVSLVGDFTGDGRDDIVWYGPGAAADYLWRWSGQGFSSTALSVGGDYVPLVGDFTGDGRDDIVWYGPGAAADYLWRWSGQGFSSTGLMIRGVYEPVVGDLDGSGRTDVLWYAAGGAADYLWQWDGDGFVTKAVSIGGSYVPITADVDASGSDDIVWYGPGGASDYLWRWSGSGFSSLGVSVGGSYIPVVGNLDGVGGDDIFWYGPGGASDYLWRWSGSGFSSLPTSVAGSYTPVVADVVPGGGHEIVWHAPGIAKDYLWRWTGQAFASQTVILDNHYRPIVGQLDGSGLEEIFWYSPGAATDPLWYG